MRKIKDTILGDLYEMSLLRLLHEIVIWANYLYKCAL